LNLYFVEDMNCLTTITIEKALETDVIPSNLYKDNPKSILI
jgi:hypothetical protein